MRVTGRYELLGDIKYFIPDSLPPKNPELNLDSETISLYGQAMLELSRLEEMVSTLPDVKQFIKAYVIKEALLSSAIEGVHTTILEIFTQPFSQAKPDKNTQLVMNYTQALDTAIFMIKKENLPITSRVILAAHKELMQLGQGDKSNPGHYRKQAVKVGNFVPSPPLLIPELISELEYFINSNNLSIPALIKAGLAHAQFEIIHPFLDGNGRIGRLLIALILVESKLLSEPILYISYYLKKHQLEYYQKLDRIRTHGEFEEWIKFYLKAIIDSSFDAYRRAKDIEILRQNLTQLIIFESKLSKKVKNNRLEALNIIFSYPVISINELSLQIKVSYNTASKIVADFINLKILVEENQQKRSRLFKFKQYIDVLEKEY